MNATRAALLQNAVDRQSGEDVLIEPMTAGSAGVNGRLVADGSRAVLTIAAVWSEPFTEYARRPHGRAESHDRDVPASRPHIKFQASLLPYALVIGDLVTRVATSDAYQAQSIAEDGFGRAMIGLTARNN